MTFTIDPEMLLDLPHGVYLALGVVAAYIASALVTRHLVPREAIVDGLIPARFFCWVIGPVLYPIIIAVCAASIPAWLLSAGIVQPFWRWLYDPPAETPIAPLPPPIKVTCDWCKRTFAEDGPMDMMHFSIPDQKGKAMCDECLLRVLGPLADNAQVPF
jgi:hypothetical protein